MLTVCFAIFQEFYDALCTDFLKTRGVSPAFLDAILEYVNIKEGNEYHNLLLKLKEFTK